MLDTPCMLQKVTPIRPAAPYVGGKRILAPEIVHRINTMPHDTYA